MANKNEEAWRLAAAHYESETGITQIYRIAMDADRESRLDEPIKLLEVNEFTSASGIMPLQFGPAPARGIHFPSIIVEVTPEEFGKIQAKELSLPEGWGITELFPRPCGNGVP